MNRELSPSRSGRALISLISCAVFGFGYTDGYKGMKNDWHKGLLTWFEGDALCVSIVFTWNLPVVRKMAAAYRRMIVGGPAVESMPDYFADCPGLRWERGVRAFYSVSTRAPRAQARDVSGVAHSVRYGGARARSWSFPIGLMGR